MQKRRLLSLSLSLSLRIRASERPTTRAEARLVALAALKREPSLHGTKGILANSEYEREVRRSGGGGGGSPF